MAYIGINNVEKESVINPPKIISEIKILKNGKYGNLAEVRIFSKIT